MKIHILGICGTFMGSLAIIAKQKGHTVTGSDQNIYPPMSTLLASHEIEVSQSGRDAIVQHQPDCVIIGNAKKRGDEDVEFVLSSNLPYFSGPEWLAQHVLRDRWVLMASGTHGKTTTSSMMAWILEFAGFKPGFLIGGVPRNFGLSGRLGESDFFVIEGDEYDTAFFDKRSKFIHYRPKTAVINNIDFDHADIFADLAAIKRQFHHMIRTLSSAGKIIANGQDANVTDMLKMGCWTPIETVAGEHSDWQAKCLSQDGSGFEVLHQGKKVAEVNWQLIGMHNIQNALAAIAATHHAGVDVKMASLALNEFQSVKKRLEIRGVVNNITVYDDFAHHPTEIATTLNALRQRVGQARIIAVTEFVSNSMRDGVHKLGLPVAFDAADQVFCRRPSWDVAAIFSEQSRQLTVLDTVDDLVSAINAIAKPGDHILVMSNKDFGNIYGKLLENLASEDTTTT